MTVCRECVVRVEETPGSALCFLCRMRSIGFTFRGGGGYTRRAFHDSTIAERRADILGDRVLGVDAEPMSTYGG